MEEFADADPDVDEAQAGDQAADPALADEVFQGGMGVEPGVLVPDAGRPGEDGEGGSDGEAEDDEDDEAHALEPDGGGRRFVGRWVRGFHREGVVVRCHGVLRVSGRGMAVGGLGLGVVGLLGGEGGGYLVGGLIGAVHCQAEVDVVAGAADADGELEAFAVVAEEGVERG